MSSQSPYLSFLSDQVIPCENENCVVENFRLRVYLDVHPNGNPKWSIEYGGLEPQCPSCNRLNYDVKSYVGAIP